MSIRGLLDLERISILDVLLPQRWARRLSTQIAKWGVRYTGLYERGGYVTDIAGPGSTPTILGGLEVGVASGAIAVTPGQLITYPNLLLDLPSYATRPASYTFQDPAPAAGPARPEGDDDTASLYDNPYFKAIPVTFGAALAASEWWIVYALRETVTTETDTARTVFNEVTGLFDAASQAKVTKRKLSFGVVRGASSAGFPVPPSGAIPLGALWLPLGATDLSTARVFDLRNLRHASREPNEIGGCWAAGGGFWGGHVWAHHRGEVLEARAMAGVGIADICSPGATWDGTASPTSPKIAWLYLARAANGRVPRWKQYGDDPVASDALVNHKFYQAGVLVLSPVPPRIGLGNAKNETAGRWDMQNSAAIALPNGYNDTNPPAPRYDFSSQSAAIGDAICVGMMVYDGVPGGVPNIAGCDVTADGWMRGEALHLVSTADLQGNPIANADIVIAGTNVTLNALRGAVGSYSVPIDGVEVAAQIIAAQAVIVWFGHGTMGTAGTDPLQAWCKFSATLPSALSGPTGVMQVARGGKVGAGAMPIDDAKVSICGVRLPYGRSLYTLVLGIVLFAVVRPQRQVVAQAAGRPLRLAAERPVWRGADGRDLRAALGLEGVALDARIAPLRVGLAPCPGRSRSSAGAARPWAHARLEAGAVPFARLGTLRAAWARADVLLARDADLDRWRARGAARPCARAAGAGRRGYAPSARGRGSAGRVLPRGAAPAPAAAGGLGACRPAATRVRDL